LPFRLLFSFRCNKCDTHVLRFQPWPRRRRRLDNLPNPCSRRCQASSSSSCTIGPSRLVAACSDRPSVVDRRHYKRAVHSTHAEDCPPSVLSKRVFCGRRSIRAVETLKALCIYRLNNLERNACVSAKPYRRRRSCRLARH